MLVPLFSNKVTVCLQVGDQLLRHASMSHSKEYPAMTRPARPLDFNIVREVGLFMGAATIESKFKHLSLGV